MASKSSSKKTMDVSKPGESAPETSSRPVLVTHRPMVQDPMMKEDAKTEDKADDKEPKGKLSSMSHGDKVIQPVSDMPKEDEAQPVDDKQDEVAEQNEPKPEASSESDEPKPEKSSDMSGSDAAVVEAVADQATEDKKKQNKQNDADKAKEAEIQKLVEQKKYFVPIGQVGRRRNRRALIIVLVLVIFLVGAYIAIDAGLLATELTLPADFIDN